MLSKILTASLNGVNPFIIEVETFLTKGLPSFNIVGLPDKIINESKDRIISGIKNSNIEFPIKKIIVNLAPADVKKEKIILDLPIAASILASLNILKMHSNKQYLFLGELSLNGDIKKINGIIPILMLCQKKNINNIIIPIKNLNEAMLISNINIIAVKNINDLIEKINNNIIEPVNNNISLKNRITSNFDINFQDVKGNHHVKRALEIAAAGMHNVIMVGPPGTGKSMLAKRMVTIMSELSLEEAIETTSIYSSRGLLSDENPLILQRPFINPHHTSSDISIIGGGRYLQCGAVSLANNGILFFDEFPLFKSNVIQALREPLVEGNVVISRIAGTIKFPASFMFIAAMNPCPCGYLNSNKNECTCSLKQIKNYYNKISGPILDRIDIHIQMPEFNFLKHKDEIPENSAQIKKRVYKAQKIQQSRIQKKTNYYNAYLTSNNIEKYITIDDTSQQILNKALNKLNFSPRSYYKILKVARTIADLDESDQVLSTHISEALQYRFLDRADFYKSNFNTFSYKKNYLG